MYVSSKYTVSKQCALKRVCKFKVCKTGGWKNTSQQPIYTVYTQHKRLRIEPISILQSAQWALLFPYNLALFALSFFVVSPSHHLFFSFAHKRLQLADSRPSVREDRSVMFLSAERRMNELPTVSEPLKPHQSLLLLLLLATTLPSHLPSFPFSMPSASPFICLVLSPSHSDFVPSSVWAVVPPTLCLLFHSYPILLSGAVKHFHVGVHPKAAAVQQYEAYQMCQPTLVKSHTMCSPTLVNLIKWLLSESHLETDSRYINSFLIGNIEASGENHSWWNHFPKDDCFAQNQLKRFPPVINAKRKVKQFEEMQMKSWHSLKVINNHRILHLCCIQLHILFLILSWISLHDKKK